MQAVLDFLLEYYYWILGVLVILLITVIGFLADTKRKKKLRAKNDNQNNNMNGEMNMNNELNNMNSFNDVNVGMDNGMNQNMNVMPEVNMNSLNNMNDVNVMTPDMNMGVNNESVPNMNADMNNMNNMNSLNNVMPTTPSEPVSSMNATVDANPIPSVVPTENVVNNTNDSFFAPASEQTPTFAPREVTIPMPVEPSPVVNNVNAVNGWDMAGNANVSPVEVPSVNQEVVPPVIPEQIPSTPVVEPQVQNVNNMDMGVNQVPNFEVNNPSTPVMPSMPVEQAPNVNVMPNTMPQVEPSVNPIPNQNMNVEPLPNVPNNNIPVTPNFVTGATGVDNMPNGNTNLNG